MGKYYNNAIIGNKELCLGFTKTGELIRACFPNADGKQFIDFFRTGLSVNGSNILYLHEDVNNRYIQKYIDDTNILLTCVENAYFKINIAQLDCVLISQNTLVKKYVFENNSNSDLDINFIVNSKILSNNTENFGGKLIANGVIQYNRSNSFSIFSNNEIIGHKLNDVANVIQSGVLHDKDCIGMSSEIGLSYKVGKLKPQESKEFVLFIHFDTEKNIENKISKSSKMNVDSKIAETAKYWQNYLQEHKKIKIENLNNKKIDKIYTRTILLYPLLFNEKTGGIAAALEVDENREKSGAYAYCWTRDAIFITKAFYLLNMEKEAELFYNNFCQSTQSKNGMWEQRFYTDTTLAPCWGYQIDETASVIYGIFKHYEQTKNKEFLNKNLKMCEIATKFLFSYVENILNIPEQDLVKKALIDKYGEKFQIYKQLSYDLWEMNEGVHLYSIASIISALECMKKIYNILDFSKESLRLKKEKISKAIEKIDKYNELLKSYINDNLINKNTVTLKRNLVDESTDISVMGTVYPFEIFDAKDKVVKNTVSKINMTLRTYTSGYLRFQGDNYMGGNNPWVITTLWMALYYIKAGQIEEALKCFYYVVNTSCDYGFLSEQVNNEDTNFKWVIGLGWSHAMFIIVMNELKDYIK